MKRAPTSVTVVCSGINIAKNTPVHKAILKCRETYPDQQLPSKAEEIHPREDQWMTFAQPLKPLQSWDYSLCLQSEKIMALINV